MRNTFAKVITELAKVDEKIVLLSGDIGNRMFDEFKKVASKRFYFVLQNMTFDLYIHPCPCSSVGRAIDL